MNFWQRLFGRQPPQPPQPAERYTNAEGVQVGHAGRDVNVYIRLMPESAAAVSPVNPSPPKRKATSEQTEVLALMRGLTDPKYSLVLAFMKREWGSTLVLDITGHDIYRLRRYVETVIENDGAVR